MKVLFLDIDGVLNWAETQERHQGFVGLDPAKIQIFNKVIDQVPDLKIVISSTWRTMHEFDELVGILRAAGLKGDIIDYTPRRFSVTSRGMEIFQWLEDHQEAGGEPIERFVVLDDDSRTEPVKHAHVQTTWYGDEDSNGGVGLVHVEDIVRRLI